MALQRLAEVWSGLFSACQNVAKRTACTHSLIPAWRSGSCRHASLVAAIIVRAASISAFAASNAWHALTRTASEAGGIGLSRTGLVLVVEVYTDQSVACDA